MPNPNAFANLATVGKRSVDVAQLARRNSAAAGKEEEDFEVPVQLVADTGGAWGSASHPALSARPPGARGWSGWDDRDKPPWNPKSELTLVGDGGIEQLERHRQTVAGQHYLSYTGGGRDVRVGGDCDLTVEGTHSVVMQRGMNSSGKLPRYGVDSLKVKGDAEWELKERTVLVGGSTAQRHWEGDILRMIGMEGTICGGLFMKNFYGLSMTMAPLASGDVYVAGAHAAGARVRVAGILGYRSTELAAWACGVYRRSCHAMTEPAINTPANNKRTGMGERALRIAQAINPLMDIGCGLLGGAAALFGLGKFLVNKLRGKKPEAKPENVGRMRTLVRTVGGIAQRRTADKIL